MQRQQIKRRREGVEGVPGATLAHRAHPTASERAGCAPGGVERGTCPGAGPAAVPVEAQVGWIASTGVTATQFNRLRLGFGDSHSPKASLPGLRGVRARMATLKAKLVTVTSTGVNLVSVSLAFQEVVDALDFSGRYIERHLRQSDSAFYRAADAYTPPA